MACWSRQLLCSGVVVFNKAFKVCHLNLSTMFHRFNKNNLHLHPSLQACKAQSLATSLPRERKNDATTYVQK